MNERLLALAQRIRDELSELERLIGRTQEGWQRATRSSDDFYLDSVALNLHGFYGGLERLFTLIASVIDGVQPGGADWHKMVLERMAAEISHVRPAVISLATREALDEYRGFRHVVRNVYTFHLDPAKMRRLIQQAPGVFGQVRPELAAFANFLEERGLAQGEQR